MKYLSKHNALVTAVMLSSSFSAPLALSNAVLEEIMVTAQKRSESVQDIPVAISSYDNRALENLGIANLSDLSIAAPSLQSYDFPTSSNTLSLFIRGLGNLDAQTLTSDNPVGIYIDNVYIARSIGTMVDLLDLERVEVLRGPQGTLYGRNASAGAINFISKKPGDTFSSQVKASVGNFGLAKLAVTADVPLSDTLRSKISVMRSSLDGWVENKGPNSVGGQSAEDFNKKDQQAARFALSWDISDSVTADYRFDYADVDSTPMYYQASSNSEKRLEKTESILTGGNNKAFQYVLPESDMEQWGHNLTVTAQLNDHTVFKSISAYREMRDHVRQNWSDSIFFGTDLETSTRAISQEFQVLGNVDKFSYVAGLYYFSEKGGKHEKSNLSNGGPDVLLLPQAEALFPVGTHNGYKDFDTDLTSTAVFGQATYAVTTQLSLTLGLRYTEDDREAERSGTNPSFPPGKNNQTYEHVDWTVIADYAVSDNMTSYAKVATGFRSGGSAERTPDFDQTFKQEEATSYELGLKSELLGNRLRLNTAIFRTELDDAINTVGGLGRESILQEVFNFGDVTIEGVEFDTLWMLGQGTSLTLNYVYLETDISNVIVPAKSVLQTPGGDLTGTIYLAQAPQHAYTFMLDHRFHLAGHNLDAHIDYVYRDKIHSSAILSEQEDKLESVNARLTLRDVNIASASADIGLWVKNLTNKEEIIYNLSGFGYQYNTPRTFGLDVKFNF